MRSHFYGLISRAFSIGVIIGVLLAGCAGTETTPTPAQGPALPTATVNSIFGSSGNQPTITMAPSSTAVPPTSEATGTPAVSATPLAPTLTSTASGSETPQATETPGLQVPVTDVQNARALPDPSGFQWKRVVSNVLGPVDLKFMPASNYPDGKQRMFIVERRGMIKVVKNGQMQNSPFLNIINRVNSTGSEQGLLGLAFDPQYVGNGFFYVNYTDHDGNTVISRFTVKQDNPDVADNSSEVTIMNVLQPFPNHNGGGMVFGPDGLLYIGLGDGGSEGDPLNNGQNLNNLLGKILRIDVTNAAAQGKPYVIPPGNPFAGGGGSPEIWAYGLRNPWRFSFDTGTYDLYIGDVGQDKWEEIDYRPGGAKGGANFGWAYMEGNHVFKSPPPQGMSVVNPIFEYSHDQGCAVIGGYVYRGKSLPEFQGVYLFGDECSGNIWGLLKNSAGQWESQLLFQTGMGISSFGQDENGEIYVLDLKTGAVYQLVKGQ